MNVLAAFPERMEDLIVMPRAEWLTSTPAQIGLWLLAGLAVVGVIRVGLAAWKPLMRRAEPVTLFNRAAAELGVGLFDRWLLWRMARQTGLRSALTLLLSRTTLDHFTARYTQDMAEHRAAHIRARIASLRGDLFGRRVG